MKNLHRWTAMLLAAAMMMVSFTACDDDDDELAEDKTEVEDNTGSDTEEEEGTEQGGEEGTEQGGEEGEEETVISSVSVSPATVTLTADATVEGEEYLLTVTSDTAWVVSIPEDASWLTASPTSGEGVDNVELTVTANESGSSRSTTLTITTVDETANCTVSVTQLAEGETSASIVVNPEEITIAAEGGSKTVTVTADVAWTAEVYVNTGSTDWVTLSATSGDAGETTLTVTAEEYTDSSKDRSINYVFKATDGSDVVGYLAITQEAAASTGSSVIVEHQTSRIEIPAAGTSITDGEADLEYIVYVYRSSEVPVLTCDNDAFKFEFIESMAASYKPGTDHVFGIVAAANTTDQVISGTLTVTVGDFYTATVEVAQANASGSYAAEVTQEVYLPLTSLTSIFGSSTATLDGTSWTLYTDDSSNVLSASFTSGSTWYYGMFSGYRLQFTNGATFAISGSDKVTFTKIELLDTGLDESFASGQITSDTGAVTVGDDLSISVTVGGSGTTYKCMVWEGSAKTINFTVNADDTYLRALRLTYTIDE